MAKAGGGLSEPVDEQLHLLTLDPSGELEREKALLLRHLLKSRATARGKFLRTMLNRPIELICPELIIDGAGTVAAGLDIESYIFVVVLDVKGTRLIDFPSQLLEKDSRGVFKISPAG